MQLRRLNHGGLSQTRQLAGSSEEVQDPRWAASGINVGKELDTFHAAYDAVSGPTASRKRVVIAEAPESKLAAYISALSKKKKSYKLYDGFEKEFLKDYVGKAHFLKNDLKRYDADAKLYQAELAKFFAAVQRLDANKATITAGDIQKFHQGALRGLTALGKSVKNVDPRPIDAELSKLHYAIGKLGATPSKKDLSDFVAMTMTASDEIAKEARALGLVK